MISFKESSKTGQTNGAKSRNGFNPWVGKVVMEWMR